MVNHWPTRQIRITHQTGEHFLVRLETLKVRPALDLELPYQSYDYVLGKNRIYLVSILFVETQVFSL